jgi:uncharacterized protein (TIGR02145 family)
MERTQTHDSQYASSFIEAIADPLITISPEGKITDMNQAKVTITGVERGKLLGTNFYDYFTDPKKACEVYKEIFASGSVTDPYYYVYAYEGSSIIEAKATANFDNYGVLYNWEAAKNACPSGWKLPTDAEWKTLTDYLTNYMNNQGCDFAIGKSMASMFGWISSFTEVCTPGNNPGSNNRSGFSALPGGDRRSFGGFIELGLGAYFWSSSEDTPWTAWSRNLVNGSYGVLSYYRDRLCGFSVRCLRD